MFDKTGSKTMHSEEDLIIGEKRHKTLKEAYWKHN